MRFRRASIVCRQAVEVATDYLEGTLSGRDRARFETHLKDCPHCRAYLEQMRATIATLGRIEPDALDERVRDDLVELYRRWKAG